MGRSRGRSRGRRPLLDGVEGRHLGRAVERAPRGAQRLLERGQGGQVGGGRGHEVAHQVVHVAEVDEGTEVGEPRAVGQCLGARHLAQLGQVGVGAVDQLGDVALVGEEHPGDVVAAHQQGADVGAVDAEELGEVVRQGREGVEQRAGSRPRRVDGREGGVGLGGHGVELRPGRGQHADSAVSESRARSWACRVSPSSVASCGPLVEARGDVGALPVGGLVQLRHRGREVGGVDAARAAGRRRRRGRRAGSTPPSAAVRRPAAATGPTGRRTRSASPPRRRRGSGDGWSPRRRRVRGTDGSMRSDTRARPSTRAIARHLSDLHAVVVDLGARRGDPGRPTGTSPTTW